MKPITPIQFAINVHKYIMTIDKNIVYDYYTYKGHSDKILIRFFATHESGNVNMFYISSIKDVIKNMSCQDTDTFYNNYNKITNKHLFLL